MMDSSGRIQHPQLLAGLTLVEGVVVANLISDFEIAGALGTCYFLGTNGLVKSSIIYDLGTCSSTILFERSLSSCLPKNISLDESSK